MQVRIILIFPQVAVSFNMGATHILGDLQALNAKARYPSIYSHCDPQIVSIHFQTPTGGKEAPDKIFISIGTKSKPLKIPE